MVDRVIDGEGLRSMGQKEIHPFSESRGQCCKVDAKVMKQRGPGGWCKEELKL